MIGVVPALCALVVSLAVPHQAAPAVPRAPETIVEIRVHGNQVATDADVIARSGLKVGDPFTPTTIDEVTKRLKATARSLGYPHTVQGAGLIDAARATEPVP